MYNFTNNHITYIEWGITINYMKSLSKATIKPRANLQVMGRALNLKDLDILMLAK